MPDNLDLDTLNRAAAEAAAASDAAGAASLLRQALDLQAASLGPSHRDLASTLNNLAMMLERLGNTDEAEQCYRRAYDIARRDAGPTDLLVQVSRANLADFLRAAGRPDALEDVTASPRAAHPAVTPAAHQDTTPPATREPAPPARQRSVPPAPRQTAPAAPSKPTAAVRDQRPVLALASLTLAVGLAAWCLGRTGGPPASPPPSASPPVQVPVVKQPPTPNAAPGAAAPAPTRGETTPPESPPAESAAARPERAAAATGSLGADTSLCEALRRTGGNWRCERLRSGTTPDAVYYYTRVKTPRDVVVRHRWTHDGAVVKTVNLRVGANMDTGFRTFSRQVIGARASGEWEVALMAADGAVIDRQSFVVP